MMMFTRDACMMDDGAGDREIVRWAGRRMDCQGLEPGEYKYREYGTA
jgi:hypothetical protein